MSDIDRSNLKQPHEGITGTDRSGDDLLSLDMGAVAHRDALISMAYQLKTACLVGNPAPVVEDMYRRITSPQPGDLVVEAGARWYDLLKRVPSLGFLIEKRREWWHTDDEWEAHKIENEFTDDEERQIDTAWYIQYGPSPGNVYRWVNCDFTVLPIGADFNNPTSATAITRDTVISDLARSGFELKPADDQAHRHQTEAADIPPTNRATTPLCDLLAADSEPPPPWADALHHAAHRFGPAIAAYIAWTGTDDDGRNVGTLTGTDGQVRLRYDCQEPGSQSLQVNVTCYWDSDCPHAWDEAETAGDLLSVLDGGDASGDPQCDHHDQ